MASVLKHNIRTSARARSVIPSVAAIVAIALLRLLVQKVPEPMWIFAAMVAAAVIIGWRIGLRGYMRGETSRRALLKAIAGSQAIVLMAFYPLWVPLGRDLPVSLIVLSGSIGVHFAVSLWTSMTVTRSEKSRSFRLVEAILPARMAPVIHAELAILWMALFTWTKPKLAPTEQSFTSYGTFAAVLFAVVALSIVEIAILHLILANYSADAAWIGTAIGVLALVYVIGILKSLKYRPTIVSDEGILARLGLLHDLFIPAASVEQIALHAPGASKPAGAANFAGITPANIVVELAHPVSLKDRLGKQRDVHAVILHVDDPNGLIKIARSRFAAG